MRCDSHAPRLMASPWIIITFPKCGSEAPALKVATCKLKPKGRNQKMPTALTRVRSSKSTLRPSISTPLRKSFCRLRYRVSIKVKVTVENPSMNIIFVSDNSAVMPLLNQGCNTPARIPIKTRKSLNRIGLFINHFVINFFRNHPNHIIHELMLQN